MKKIRAKLASEQLAERICYTTLCFCGIFFPLLIFSYYFLPEALLRGKTGATFEMTGNLLSHTLQIFRWNLLSVGCLLIGSLFSKKTKKEKHYFSTGYTVFFVLIAINAITLGTWSFSVESVAVPLTKRIIGLFQVNKNAGLIEMFGQLLILCSLANISLVRVCGKEIQTRKFSAIKLTTSEKIGTLLGLLLIFVGALIESHTILNR